MFYFFEKMRFKIFCDYNKYGYITNTGKCCIDNIYNYNNIKDIKFMVNSTLFITQNGEYYLNDKKLNIGNIKIDEVYCGNAYTIFISKNGREFSFIYKFSLNTISVIDDRIIKVITDKLNYYVHIFALIMESGKCVVYKDYIPQELPIKNVKTLCFRIHETLILTNDGELYIWKDELVKLDINEKIMEIHAINSKFVIIVEYDKHILMSCNNKIMAINGNIVKEVMVGQDQMLLMMNDGKIYGYGDNSNQNLGFHASHYYIGTPTEIEINAHHGVCSAYTSLFVTDDGVYYCGMNGMDKLSDDMVALNEMFTKEIFFKYNKFVSPITKNVIKIMLLIHHSFPFCPKEILMEIFGYLEL